MLVAYSNILLSKDILSLEEQIIVIYHLKALDAEFVKPAVHFNMPGEMQDVK